MSNYATTDAGQHGRNSGDNLGTSLVVPEYDLQDEIGRGGMGVVYRARDRRLNREVAIKVLQHDAADNGPATLRFRAEACITGQLQHPSIPSVHELGTLPDGRTFLAMKLVRGRTLQEILKDRSNAAQEMGRFLAIFEQICQAVGYAHAHGVIHRDLKPANVMVGAFGEVQVMDWGLAKRLVPNEQPEPPSTNQSETDTAVADESIDTPAADGSTRTGSVLGTPAYMPPEQAGGEVRLLDSRSDVFGLGAILCQILTGRPPYGGVSVNDLRLKAVRGETAEAMEMLDACGAEPELVALCKRCLAFRQDDRPTNGQVVAETVASIRNQAEARARRAELERAEAQVREGEQRRRQRTVQRAAGIVAVVLMLGIVGTAVGLFQANAARRSEKIRADHEAEAKQQAQKSLVQVEKGVELFAGLVSGLNPEGERRGAPPLYEQLRERAVKAADSLIAEAVGDPEAVARLQALLGETLHELGALDKAVEVLERASATLEARLGIDHRYTLDTQTKLASVYYSVGKVAESLALLERVRDGQVRTLGAEDLDTLITLNALGNTYRSAGKLPEATAMYEQARDAYRRKLGPEDPYTLTATANVASAYRAAGKLTEAIALLEQVRDAQVAKLGVDHAFTLITMNNLALAYEKARKLPEAIALYERVHAAQVKKLGDHHPTTLTIAGNMADAYREAGQLPRAVALFDQVAAELEKRKFQPERTGHLLAMAFKAYEQASQFGTAESWRRKWLAVIKERAGAESLPVATELAGLGSNLLQQQRWTDAEAVLRECVAIRGAKEAEAWTTFDAQSRLGAALLGQRKVAEAEPLLVKGYGGIKALEKSISPSDVPRLSESIDRLIELYMTTNKPNEVKRWKAERAKYPTTPDSPRRTASEKGPPKE